MILKHVLKYNIKVVKCTVQVCSSMNCHMRVHAPVYPPPGSRPTASPAPQKAPLCLSCRLPVPLPPQKTTILTFPPFLSLNFYYFLSTIPTSIAID